MPKQQTHLTETDTLLEGQGWLEHEVQGGNFRYSTESLTTLLAEFRYILKNSPLIVVTLLLQFSLNFISIYYVKQFGENKLAAASLSNTIYYVSGSAIFNGFATSLDTLCSQAYGAKNYYNVGLYCQRCFLLMLIVLVPLTFFHFNCATTFIKRFFIDDPEIVESCNAYMRVLVLGSPGLVLFEVLKRFVQSQGIFHPPAVALTCLFPINLALNSFAVPRYGYLAVPSLIALNYWSMGVGLLIYIAYTKNSKDPRRCFQGILGVRELFHNVRGMLVLSSSGIVMVVSEAMAFQILTFMTCKLSIHEMAAQSIVSTIANGVFQMPFGVAICCCTRLANIIGTGNIPNLNILKRTYFFIALILGIINFLFLISSASWLSQIFNPSDDPSNVVRILTTKVLIIIGINQFADCFNIICAGVLRAQGRQTTGSILSFISFYFIALPLEVFLAFNLKMGIEGLWAGLAFGVFLLALCEAFCVINLNWSKIIGQFLTRETKSLIT